MVDVRGDVLRPPHGTTPAAVKSNIKSEMRSFKSIYIHGQEIFGSTSAEHSMQSELPRPIKIRPRMYVRRSIMYEKAAFCSPEENSSVAR